MIDLELIYRSDLIEVKVNERERYIQTIWLKHPTCEEFRNETGISAHYALVYKANKALFDVSKKILPRYHRSNSRSNLGGGGNSPFIQR